MSNVNDLLRDHLTLTVECLDRIYVAGYIPTLQMPGQLVNSLLRYRGNKIPSPALVWRITDAFVAEVMSYDEQEGIAIVRFAPGERKDDIGARYRRRFARSEGVVFIGGARKRARRSKLAGRTRKGTLSHACTPGSSAPALLPWTPRCYCPRPWRRPSARLTRRSTA